MFKDEKCWFKPCVNHVHHEKWVVWRMVLHHNCNQLIVWTIESPKVWQKSDRNYKRCFCRVWGFTKLLLSQASPNFWFLPSQVTRQDRFDGTHQLTKNHLWTKRLGAPWAIVAGRWLKKHEKTMLIDVLCLGWFYQLTDGTSSLSKNLRLTASAPWNEVPAIFKHRFDQTRSEVSSLCPAEALKWSKHRSQLGLGGKRQRSVEKTRICSSQNYIRSGWR